jgi:hypothetical protein
MWHIPEVYSVFFAALGESFVSVGVVAVFPYDDALLIFVIPIIFDNNKKTENKSRAKWNSQQTNTNQHTWCFSCHSSKISTVAFNPISLFCKDTHHSLWHCHIHTFVTSF